MDSFYPSFSFPPLLSSSSFFPSLVFFKNIPNLRDRGLDVCCSNSIYGMKRIAAEIPNKESERLSFVETMFIYIARIFISTRLCTSPFVF